jgi:hypothetical protein
LKKQPSEIDIVLEMVKQLKDFEQSHLAVSKDQPPDINPNSNSIVLMKRTQNQEIKRFL